MINIDSVIKIQNKIYDMLKASKANNRLSHAYLFYGEEGVGKKEMAYALAALLYSNGNDIDFNSVDGKMIVCTAVINSSVKFTLVAKGGTAVINSIKYKVSTC